MSVKCSTWVWEHSETTGNERIVMLVLADEANDDGFSCYPGIARIAKKARISERTVQRCLERIAQIGEILIKRPERQGKGMHNQYALCLNRPPQQTADLLGWPDEVLDVIQEPERVSVCHPLETDERVTNKANSDPQRVTPVSSNPPIRKYPVIDNPPTPLEGGLENQKVSRDAAFRVQCPSCNAPPAQFCLRNGGGTREQPHRSRFGAAVELPEASERFRAATPTDLHTKALEEGRGCQACASDGIIDNAICPDCMGKGFHDIL